MKTSALQTDEAREAHRVALQSESYKEIHRVLAKERMSDPDMKARIALSLQEFGARGQKSIPEQKVEAILDKLLINYTPQKAVGPYNFDIYIPNGNLYIEVQGEYWHHLPNNSLRDISKLEFLRNSDPKSKILYIWDYELLNMINVEQKIKNFVGMSDFPSIDFDLNDVVITKTSREVGQKFLESWHYLQHGRSASLYVSASIDDDAIGIAKFSHVVREEVATSEGLLSKQVLELDRFCIHPSRHKKNFASYFLSKAVSHAFSNAFSNDIKAIISFADTSQGHLGSIYKACNWKEVSRVKPDYSYRDPKNGWYIHKKTLFDKAKRAGMKEREYAKLHGLERVYGLEKIKFVLERK